MFLPDNLRSQSERIAERTRKGAAKQACFQIERWSVELIPRDARGGVIINVQEVECSDPDCSPVDTAIAILFPSGGRGLIGLKCEAKDVKKQDLIDSFPTHGVLQKWSRGEEADWPPLDFDESDDDEGGYVPKLRFEVGQRVECRTGPDPVSGWVTGEVIQQWYREDGWPPNSWAPYKILLDNGKKLFAPADQDHIIRAEMS